MMNNKTLKFVFLGSISYLCGRKEKIMKRFTCVLFDMDGVMLDTESQYDIFWKHASDRFNTGIPDFEKKIKGTTLPNILKKYFSVYSQKEQDALVEDLDRFESNMKYPEIPGSIAFVKTLKAEGYKVGLVTSSTDTKLVGVYKAHGFDQLFDTIVSAARVEHGKPSPDCFLLAAKDLAVAPQDCVVFEDSFAGIEAGTSAGMKVIGLATTHAAEQLEDKCAKVINNFEGQTIALFDDI